MTLLNRSPGYVLEEQIEVMNWPDLNLVPYLRNVTKGNFDDDFCKGLEGALRTASKQDVVSELNKLKKEVGGKSQLRNFFKRFLVEYDREQRAIKDRTNGIELNDLSKNGRKLALNGFFVDRLPEDKIKEIQKNLQGDIDRLLDPAFKPSRTYRDYDRSTTYTKGANMKLVESILRGNGVIFAAEEYFGFPMRVKFVTLHVSLPDDVHISQVLSDKEYKPKTQGLHFDPKSSTIKSILYLKDVTEDDGPFSYLPKTHNLINPPLERLSAKANCTINYLDSDVARENFMKLPEKLRKTSIFGSITDDSDELSKEILKRERLFLSNDGNVIVFDPAMQHRGGACKSGCRISLQIGIRG